MKTRHLPILFLTLVLNLCTEPMVHAAGLPNPPDHTDATEPPPFGLDGELIEPRDVPVGALGELSVSPTIQSSAIGWQTEYVDRSKQFSNMTDRSLRLDDAGHPHIAYGEDHLYYAWYDGTQWHYETVDESSQVGQYASLALDGTGHPHISYYDAANGNLKYAWQNGMSWQIETADSEGDVGQYTSLALDGSGHPHISYYDVTNDDLKYTWYNGTSWQIETVDSEGDVGRYTSLALDGANHPHISYHDRSNYSLKYAWHNGTNWQIETVDSGEGMGMYTSLALDGTGLAHISYYTWYNSGTLKHARYDGTSWQIETVDSEGVGMFTSLALDGADRPHISYFDNHSLNDSYPPYGLKYAWHDGANWHVETVDGTVGIGWYTSLALDRMGRPHISYYYDALKYAWHNGVSWRIETVDSKRDVSRYTSLALDGAGRPHISYYDSGKGDLKYAWHNGTSWQIETVDSGGVGLYTSLALDGAGRPHISYHDGTNDALKYAWHNGVSWQIETVESGEGMGWYTSLALDKAGRPHIAYYHAGHYVYHSYSVMDLKYAWHNGENWQVETVDSEWVRGCISLALDGADHPHISYAGLYIKYAWHNGVSWQIETVDSKGGVGLDISLALDGADRPHISYTGELYCEWWYCYHAVLKYAWYNGASWQIETVDGEGRTGWYTSLALNQADRPHISYYDANNSNLKYAWHNGESWQIKTVDSKGQAGRYTSLALDEAGWPHISYGADDDLKYVRQTSFLNNQATPSDGLHYDDTLTYTLTFAGSGSNVRLWDPLPDVVHYVPSSITGTVTPTVIYSPTTNAVLWEGTLPTNTVQTVHFQVTPDITFTKSLTSPRLITNTAWLADVENGRTITATAVATVMPPPLSLNKRATPSDGLRNNDTLTYTLTISGPGLNVRLWDPLPPLVRYVPGSITDTIGIASGTLALPAAVYSPTAHAVVWEGKLPTDTVEVIRFQITPGIAGTGSLDLARPIVNTAWLTATESGRSVSATVIVNGWRRYLPLVLRGD